MKIIDLLNIWVEDRNKLPKKIKVDDETYVYDNRLNLYKIPKKDYFLISNYLNCVERLDIEVEVIEGNKEIDTINAYKLTEAPYMAQCLREKQFDTFAELLKQSELEIVERVNDLVYAVKELIKEREEK